MKSNDSTIIILYDNSQPQWDDIAQRLVDFTEFKLDAVPLPTVVTKDIDGTLRKMDDQYRWCVVVSAGSKFNNPQIFFDIINHCIKENSPFAGHLILKNNYVHFHPQFFCVDLNVYKKFTDSLLADYSMDHVMTPKIDWSDEHAHDNYTPLWCKPIDTEIKQQHTGPLEFGQKFIAYLMRNKHQAINIPQHIRNQKTYCYAEYSHDDLRQFMADPSYLPEKMGVRQFVQSINNEYSNLEVGFYPLNSERLADGDIHCESIQIFAGVCGGIKPVVITSQKNFAKNCRVILFDISPMALEWQRYLRERWDGDFKTFEIVYRDFLQLNTQAQACINRSVDENIDWFLADKCTRDEFVNMWRHWLTLDVEYIHCNLLEKTAQTMLLNKINSIGGAAYIWTSNLFYMDWQMFLYGHQWSHDVKTRWVNLLQEYKTNTIILENEQMIKIY